MCTTTEPALMVRNIDKSLSQQGVMHGLYEFRCDPPKGDVLKKHRLEGLATLTVKDETRPWNTFCMELNVGGTRRGAWNRLSWLRYWCVSERRSDVDEFECHAWKPYYFSRVRSYGG